ncbi:MAG: hypothetical protein LW870_04675 [Pirellula sp.]|nr:hypothetical protein [Pirellula sp.]
MRTSSKLNKRSIESLTGPIPGGTKPGGTKPGGPIPGGPKPGGPKPPGGNWSGPTPRGGESGLRSWAKIAKAPAAQPRHTNVLANRFRFILSFLCFTSG